MITYHKLVLSVDIPRLDSTIRDRIKSAIEAKLEKKPHIYGSPLKGSLKRIWKLRVGDWRVLYFILPNEAFIMMIDHRDTIYKNILKRL